MKLKLTQKLYRAKLLYHGVTLQIHFLLLAESGVIFLYRVQNLRKKVFVAKKHKVLSEKKSKDIMLKNPNGNYREVILEIENDAMIYRLLNPGWESEDLKETRNKKQKNQKKVNKIRIK